MRTVVCSLSLLVVSVFGVGPQDKDKDKDKTKGEGVKCESEYLEKTWGIKCKSVTDRSDTLQLLMEFTKDVESNCQMLWTAAASGGFGLLHPIDKPNPGDDFRKQQ